MLDFNASFNTALKNEPGSWHSISRMAMEAALTPALWPPTYDAKIKVPAARLEPIIIELVDIGNPFGLGMYSYKGV